jgi:HEAT repeat protein
VRLAQLNPSLDSKAKEWIDLGLQDKDYDVRLTSVVGIGMLGLPYEQACKLIVSNPKEPSGLRAAACKSLAQLKDLGAVEMLLKVVNSNNSQEVAEAARS